MKVVLDALVTLSTNKKVTKIKEIHWKIAKPNENVKSRVSRSLGIKISGLVKSEDVHAQSVNYQEGFRTVLEDPKGKLTRSCPTDPT